MEGKLALHTKQFHAVAMNNGSSWVRRHHACLLLTHHPPMWLDEESQQHLYGEISSNRNFVVHLCGHTHHTGYKSTSEDFADIQRYWQSRSLFGLSYFLDKNGEKTVRSHGYTVGKIELKKEKGNLTFWPRQAQIQGKERSIVPDHSVKLVKGDHTKPIQFKLHQPCNDSSRTNDRYGRKINIFSLKLSFLIKESICDHQQQIVEYIFEATTKNINLQNNLNSTDNQSLLRICREFDQFLVDKLRKAFNTTKEQLQKYYRLRDENIFGNHKIQPRVCFKTYRSEDRHIYDIFRNSISPFLIDKNIGFIRVTEDRKFYICRNIPEEAKAGTYKNSRLIKNRVKQYELVEKKDYFENGNDIEWIKCWRGYGRRQKASTDSCYKSTLIIPVSLVYDRINDFVAKRLKIDEAFDGTLFGYLCLDHQCQYYFSEDRPDVSMGYILADMLSLYMIARISYITSSPYKQALSKLRESGLTLNDPLYKSSTL